MPETLRSTPLNSEHRALGARMVGFAGWEMPIQYRGISKEHQVVRERAGLFDVSHMGRLRLEGERAAEVTHSLVTNDVAGLSDGRALYACACNSQGTILDDLIVYRRTSTDVAIICNASNREKIVSHFAQEIGERCIFADRSDETGLLALQGPKSFAVLASAGAAQIAELGRFSFAEFSVAGVSVMAARTGYTGEDGVELVCDRSDAVTLWRGLLEAGAPLGLEPVGLGARDTLRLEACLSLYGNEIDESTHPYEAGLGFAVKLDRGDFIGRDALRAIKDAGLSRKLVGFEMVGRGIARHGYRLLDAASAEIGVCTSGAPSPTLGKNIGLGYVPVALASTGTELLVDCRGKQIPARVGPTPFYKRERRGT